MNRLTYDDQMFGATIKGKMSVRGDCATFDKAVRSLFDYELTGFTPAEITEMKNENARLARELEAAKRVIDEHHISLLQYMSLRHNFHSLVEAVMGEDYYNLGCDVYTCDYFCCEDLAFAAKKGRKIVKRFKKLAD